MRRLTQREDSYKRSTQVDGRLCILDILDTAGQEDYSALRDQVRRFLSPAPLHDKYMRTGEGFIIVYSVTDRLSFNEASALREAILRAQNCDETHAPPILLVGNKIDLREDRVVAAAEGEEAAKRWKCEFLETTAKERERATQVFEEMVRAVRKQREGGAEASRTGTKKKRSEAKRRYAGCALL